MDLLCSHRRKEAFFPKHNHGINNCFYFTRCMSDYFDRQSYKDHLVAKGSLPYPVGLPLVRGSSPELACKVPSWSSNCACYVAILTNLIWCVYSWWMLVCFSDNLSNPERGPYQAKRRCCAPDGKFTNSCTVTCQSISYLPLFYTYTHAKHTHNVDVRQPNVYLDWRYELPSVSRYHDFLYSLFYLRRHTWLEDTFPLSCF